MPYRFSTTIIEIDLDLDSPFILAIPAIDHDFLTCLLGFRSISFTADHTVAGIGLTDRPWGRLDRNSITSLCQSNRSFPVPRRRSWRSATDQDPMRTSNIPSRSRLGPRAGLAQLVLVNKQSRLIVSVHLGLKLVLAFLL